MLPRFDTERGNGMTIIGLRQTQSAPAIAKLINMAYRGASGDGRWTSEHNLIAGDRITTESLVDTILDPQTRVFAAFDEDDQPRCCIVVEFKDGDNSADIGVFAVHPDEQGTGLGSKLLAHAERYASKRVNTFRVLVVNESKALIEFYQRKGYRLTGKTEPYPTEKNVGTPLVEGIHLVVLEKVRS